MTTLISDPHKWGDSRNHAAISPNCRFVAVRVLSHFDYSDERYEKVYVYSDAGNELTSFRSPHGGEEGIIFWPDNQHLLIPGYDFGKQKITVMQRSLRDGSLRFPFQHTCLEDTSQHIIGSSKDGHYIAGWSSSPGNDIKCWYYDTFIQKLVIRLEYALKAVFSDNGKFAFFTSGYSYASFGDTNHYLLNLTTNEKSRPQNEKAWRTPSQGQETFLCFSKDSNYCLFSSPSGIISRTLPDLQNIRIANLETETFSCGNASEDGKIFVLGCVNGDIYILSADDLQVIGHYFSGSSSPWEATIHHIQMSTDNRSVIAVNRNTISIYRLEYS